jgi:hypothetical protein
VRLAVVIAASACSAHSSITIDAAPGGDARRDAAMPDTRACTGGDGHATDATGNCFVFFLGPKTWVEGKAACEALPGGKFAKITSAAQNVVIEGLAHGHATFFGATDSATEGTFLWTDGTPLTYNNFRAGVPDNGGNVYQEDCLIIEGNKTPDDTWDDRPCDPSEVPTSGNFAYLCEY